MAQHLPLDSRVHHGGLRSIVDRGFAPTTDALTAALRAPAVEVVASLQRLHDNHGLVLHPGSAEVWIAHPFSLSLGQLDGLARRWYGRHLDPDWVKWTPAEAAAIFAEVGLTGPFWALDAGAERF